MLSKQSQYVLRALACLVRKNEQMDIKTIAEEERIPSHFLATLMQELARKKIVSSKKGKNGGFYLNEKQSDISLFEVISHFEDVDKFYACGMGFDKCSEKSPCPLHNYYKAFREEFKKMLRMKKIRDLANG
ncbi:MAG: hypothetical protein KatS3mg027_2129 [Bacteroidia bacterium]|nr:MAG: hypothetical protein KatS3mg027_2129 [Bacteroidia bacterium]